MKKKSKVVIFDLDGTLISGIEYIYSHLWEYFDVAHEKHKQPVLDYLNKRITYEQWVKEDIRLLKEAGFRIKGFYDCRTFVRASKSAYRVCVVARRVK